MKSLFETINVLFLSLHFKKRFIVSTSLALCLSLAILLTILLIVHPVVFHPASFHFSWSLADGPGSGSEPWE